VNSLSVTDLFLAGLALDISGAILLARGLLISPNMIVAVSATLWGGNPETAKDRCRNRVDGEFGVAYLGLGFLLQATGYSLEIAGVHSETGTKRLIAALIVALVAFILAWIVWWPLHQIRLHRLWKRVEWQQSAEAEEAAFRAAE
jgi:hypothetical protein